MDKPINEQTARWLIAVALLFIPIQGSLLNIPAIADIRPDMAVMAVYFGSLALTPLRTSILGILAGLLTDILSGAALGIGAFSKMLAGIAAAYAGRRLFVNRALAHSFVLFLVSLVDGITTFLFLSYFYNGYTFFTSLAYVIIPQAAYTALAGSVFIVASEPAVRLVVKIKRQLSRERTNAVRGV